ncbi:flavin-containing monooxygenase [Modestobacter lapidis]|nr:NAD(P)/FAD-dependent oxidoreductase [Modestobacter lapidis]
MTVMETVDTSTTQAHEAASRWVQEFGAALEGRDLAALDSLFVSDGWWRDLLTFTWDLRTFHGTDAMRAAVGERLAEVGPSRFSLVAGKEPQVVTVGEGQQLQVFFEFETALARAVGFARLSPTGDVERPWRAWTVLTQMQALKGHEELSGPRRPKGADHGSHVGRENWFDRRAREREFINDEPQVLIVGAGQSGLSLAARLQHLGVKTLMVERSVRVGDSWRSRYYSLALHDPVWVDHLPYLRFPENWPIFTPKDKLADWFESYVSAMELNVWTATAIVSCSYDDSTRQWTVRVRRGDGSERTLHPNHVVLATGMSGEPRIPTFAGLEDFGGTIVHSSNHGGGQDWKGKNAVVIGGGNSAHDICHDFYEQGIAGVTMVQRSSTYVVSSEQFLTLHAGVYEEGGPDVDDADLMSASVPYNLLPELHIPATAQIAENDGELLDGLRRAGFKLDFGDDGSGLFMKYLRGNFAYYIDVGASQLIADGKIGLKQGVEVSHLTKDGVVFADGTFVPADIIVMATGYGNMRETARKVIGDAADQCREAWGLDDEGELKAVWRRSGHEGFWYMAGNLQAARHYSLMLALQLKAIEEGLLEKAEPAA